MGKSRTVSIYVGGKFRATFLSADLMGTWETRCFAHVQGSRCQVQYEVHTCCSVEGQTTLFYDIGTNDIVVDT